MLLQSLTTWSQVSSCLFVLTATWHSVLSPTGPVWLVQTTLPPQSTSTPTAATLAISPIHMRSCSGQAPCHPRLCLPAPEFMTAKPTMTG